MSCSPRPAPLVWTHPLDAMKEKAPARQLRARDRASPEKAGPAVESNMEHDDEPDPSPQVPPPPPSKKTRLAEPKARAQQPELRRKRDRMPVQSKPTLHRFTPLPTANPPQPPTALAILAAVGAQMLSLETWKQGSRLADPTEQR